MCIYLAHTYTKTTLCIHIHMCMSIYIYLDRCAYCVYRLHTLYIYIITDTSITFTFPCFFPVLQLTQGNRHQRLHGGTPAQDVVRSHGLAICHLKGDPMGDGLVLGFFVPETMAFYHQHTWSSCKFSLNTNEMIQAKRWMGRVSAVIWTRDTSTRNLLVSAHTSHCSSRLLFISHFCWINSCL